MKLFKTGHELFDLISNLRTGSLISVLDETYSESMDFLNALLSNLNGTPVYVLSPQEVQTPFNVIKLDVTQSLNDINLTIAGIREKIKRGVLIHRYLPHILGMGGDESAILRMLNYWSNKIANTGLVEFFLLPQGTFMPFEKKLQAITDGVIVIKIEKRDETYQPLFSIIRGSKPTYHFIEFPCLIKREQLFIKWGNKYTVHAPKGKEEEIGTMFVKNEKKKVMQQKLLNNTYCI